MYYTLVDSIPQLLNKNFPPAIFKLEQVDGKCLPDQHQPIQSDSVNFSLHLNQNVVGISDTPGGDFSLSTG